MREQTGNLERTLYWTLIGRLMPDNTLVHLPGILTAHRPRYSLDVPASPLRIELLDGEGGLLLSHPVPLMHYDRSDAIAVRAKVPFNEETKLIRFWNDQVLVKEWVRPETAPVIKDFAVKHRDGRLYLHWEASHPEKAEMQYVVRFSRNGEETFNRLSGRLDQPKYEVAEEELPGGRGCIFQIAATDGINTTTMESKPMDLPETPPLVEISWPPDGHQARAGQRVVFSGELVPFLGDSVAISSALWTSDKDGDLSNESSFDTDQLSVGTHRITLTIVDSQQRSYTTSITFDVV